MIASEVLELKYKQLKIDKTPWVALNPLIPMSDQDRISPYYISSISCRQVMRIEKNISYKITN